MSATPSRHKSRLSYPTCFTVKFFRSGCAVAAGARNTSFGGAARKWPPRNISLRNSSGNGRSGFTFIELLVALVYFSTSVIFLVTFFSSSTTGTMDAHRETVAYLLAVEALEWVGSLDYNTLLMMYLRKDPRVESDKELARLGNFIEEGSPTSTEKLFTDISYPDDHKEFKRWVTLSQPWEGLIKVAVVVETQGGWFMRRGHVKLARLVGRGQ